MDSAPTDGSPVIAIAHDYLTQRGGAERVVLTLSDSFPGAVIHTSCFEPSQTYQEFGDLDVCTTFLDRIRPIRRDPRKGIALLAPAFTAHRVDADLVVASSSAWAHGVTTDAPVIVYCHAPARWLHSPQRYAPGGSGGSRALGLAATGLSKTLGLAVRRWDAAAMARASKVFVNSRAIATQVAEIYGIDAEVLDQAQIVVRILQLHAQVGLHETLDHADHHRRNVFRIAGLAKLHCRLEGGG